MHPEGSEGCKKRTPQVTAPGPGVWSCMYLRLPLSCPLHMAARRGSERTGKNPKINMLTSDGVFVATRFMVALSLPLLSPSSAPAHSGEITEGWMPAAPLVFQDPMWTA